MPNRDKFDAFLSDKPKNKGEYLVLVRVGDDRADGPKQGYSVAPNEPYPAIFRRVFGPASESACQAFVVEHERGG